jgi:4-hydroxybenzoate polyprenyltransferase
MHLLNHLINTIADRYNDPERAEFYEKHKLVLSILAIVSGAAGLLSAFSISPYAITILIVMSLLGMSYNMRMWPFSLFSHQYQRLRDIPGSKTFLIALAWAVVTVGFPSLALDKQFSIGAVVLFAWSFGMVLVRTIFFDILDMQGDRIVGRETLAIVLGEARSLNILKWFLGILIVLFILSVALMVLPLLALPLLLCLFTLFYFLRAYEEKKVFPGLKLEFLLESNFILAGLIALIGTIFL